MTNDKLILIIDDEEDIREVAQMCLELTSGWRTEGVGSGVRVWRAPGQIGLTPFFLTS